MLQAILVLLVAALISSSYARVYKGSLDGSSSFTFLGKFVFDYNPQNDTDSYAGTVSMLLDYTTKSVDPSNADLKVLVFYDDVWSEVYNKDTYTCQEKVAKGSDAIKVDFMYNNTSPYCTSANSLCSYTAARIYQRLRPRYWYVAIVHGSDCTKPVSLPSYRLEFTNNVHGSETQLGFDEYGVIPLYILALAVWGIGFVIHLVAHMRSYDLSTSSPIVRLFHLSFFLGVASLVLYVIHWTKYSQDGVGSVAILEVGEAASVVSIVLMWFMLAFLSEGYGISKALLSENSYKKRIGAITIFGFVAAYIGMEFWYFFGRDPASTNYIYDSPPGIVVCIVQVIYAIWCGYNIVNTYSNEDGNMKRNWYSVCIVVYGFFFVSVPAIAILGSVLDPWVRFKGVTIATTVVNTLVYASTIFLLFPSLVVDIFKLPKKGANFQDDFVGGYENL